MWTWFNDCSLTGFVNCYFRTEGPCQNPKHNLRLEEDARATRTVYVGVEEEE